MESNTKVRLERPVIQSLVDRSFGGTRILSVDEMTDGFFNTAWHIVLDKEPFHTVLKVAPADGTPILSYEAGIMKVEVDTMRLVSSDSRIPVPRIHAVDYSREIIPHDYYFMDFLTGKPWNTLRKTLTPDQNAALESQLGSITAGINAFTNPFFGLCADHARFDNWPDAFRWMCGLLFADAGRYAVPVPVTENEFFHIFDEHAKVFIDVTTPQLVHWDLWEGNVFISLDGERPFISGIVDFERALWGDPLMEVFLGRGARATHYLDGYGVNLLATDRHRTRRAFYNLYLYLVMVVEDGPRQYTDKRTVRWASDRLSAELDAFRRGDYRC